MSIQLQPASVFEAFSEINQVPRPSKREDKMMDYLVSVGRQLGLETVTDEIGNVVIRKPATPGMEDRPVIVLQSHMDMVCEKNNDVEFDFDRDAIQTYVDGEWLTARGTTLGADDGIGCAMEIALLRSTDIKHGPLECVFTRDEETGLTGAENMPADFIRGRMMINLDNEEEGYIFVSCAGGCRTSATFHYQDMETPGGYFFVKLTVKGLTGGHSGDDINKMRANANKLLARFLYMQQEQRDIIMSDIQAGGLHNAIPREASCIIGVPFADKEQVRAEWNIFASDVEGEYTVTEKTMQFLMESAETPATVIDRETSRKLIYAMQGVFNGEFAHCQDIDLVETSSNLASIRRNAQDKTIIGTKFNKIATSDTVQWSENSLPPTVTLTESTKELIDNPQESNNPLTLGVYIRTLVGISYANVYVRRSGTDGIFTQYALHNVRDSLWEFTVPASVVTAPGIDFYVIAADALGQAGKSPRIQNPANQPYTIFVDNDIPAIEAVSVACEDSTSDLKTFRFSIKDSDGIDRAILYYKDSRAIIFQQMPLSYSGKNDTWVAEFSANVRDYDMLFYYLRVTDAKGASVRSPKEGTLATDACRIHYVDDNDSSVTDPVPEDSILPPSPRDSIVYSLIADSAEMYDKDLDGRADFVCVHFKDEREDNITSIDSIFWNSNRGEWRYVPEGTIKQDRSDGTWFGAYINKPYKYGLTKADSAHPPFLAFSTVYSEELENVRLLDRVGAVPARATKFPGKIGLDEYMDPNSEMPPDTLLVTLSEPVINVGDEKGWEKLFRYSESCDDTVSHPFKLKHSPKIRENGQQWMLVLDDYSVKAGFCLSTDPSATYEDLAGNSMGRGGIKIEGKDGSLYLAEVHPLQAVSGIGKTPKWIPPDGDEWESLPDSLAAISVKATMPYTAEVYIFDGIASYVTHFKQKFGYDGEMDQSIRGKPGDLFRQGYLHWNKRSDKGRKAGTGVYIWKIFFKFEDGHKETRIVKTGVWRGSRK